MTTVSDPAAATTAAESSAEAAAGGQSRNSRRVGLGVGALVCVVVAVLAQLPFLRNRLFYIWDDSAVQFIPTWHFLGQRLMVGEWPVLFNVDSWMGGNFSAEALFGVWNPISVANYLLVAQFSDLALAALVVKTEFLVLLALGAYLLTREYGAKRGPAAVVAIALPFSGFTLFYDTSLWAGGLIAFTTVPYVWWAARRLARGVANPLWAFLFGGLAVTSGNPYGVLGVCAVLFALIVEFWFRGWRSRRAENADADVDAAEATADADKARRRGRLAALLPVGADRRSVLRLLVVGVLIGLVVPLVFLPLLGNSDVTWRTNKGFNSTGTMTPQLSDFINLAIPSHEPMINGFSANKLAVPGMYFAWFVVPLLPWLNWRVLRERWRGLLGLFVVAAGYCLFAIGPSDLWMFRFPLRHVEVIYLALGVVFAVLLSAGLRTDRVRARGLVTALILVLNGWLAFATQPFGWRRHLVSMVLLGVGTAVVVLLTRRRAARLMYPVFALVTAIALVLQVLWFPFNRDVANYGFSRSIPELREVAARYKGTTFQVADVFQANVPTRPDAEEAKRTFLFGNIDLVAGVDMVGSYTGMGFRSFSDTVCMGYQGSTCANSWYALQRPTELAGAQLLDLLRLETVVIDRLLIPNPTVPAGWRITQQDRVSTVLQRIDPLPWGTGRLSWNSANVTIHDDGTTDDQHETVRFSRTGDQPAQLAFARLAWPGYQATVNGVSVPTREGPAGLLVVDLPPGVNSGDLKLTWEPRGFTAGLASGAFALLAALVLAVVTRVRRRGHGRFGSASQPR